MCALFLILGCFKSCIWLFVIFLAWHLLFYIYAFTSCGFQLYQLPCKHNFNNMISTLTCNILGFLAIFKFEVHYVPESFGKWHHQMVNSYLPFNEFIGIGQMILEHGVCFQELWIPPGFFGQESKFFQAISWQVFLLLSWPKKWPMGWQFLWLVAGTIP